MFCLNEVNCVVNSLSGHSQELMFECSSANVLW